MLSLRLCDCSDAYILVKGTITITNLELKVNQIIVPINR